MKQININKSYPSIMRLCEFKLPIKKARQIYRISKEIREIFDFAVAEEKKSVAECHGAYNPDGTVKFSSQGDFEQFQCRMEELNNSEIDWKIEPVILTEDDIGAQTISVSDIQDLEGFVIFE